VAYLKKLRAAVRKPILAVLTGGSPVAMPEVHELADAILYVWYPGEEGGHGIADVIFGDAVPSGRLPVTFPKSVDQLPPYTDYSMAGRTYRYMEQEPLYPFGFGLSYTRFAYSNPRVSAPSVRSGEAVEVTVTVTNQGPVAAEEVVQCYLSDLEASVPVPKHSLTGFQRIRLWEGESRDVTFRITPGMMELVNEQGQRVLEPGRFRVTVGGASPGPRAVALGAPTPATLEYTVQ
jgi:beta-glucosidase